MPYDPPVVATVQDTPAPEGFWLVFGEPEMVLVRVERPGYWAASIWLSPHDGRLCAMTVPPDPEQE